MTETSPAEAPPRRLTRSTDDRVVAGVCGGLARYTGIDPVIFRVAIAVATVLGGFGVVAYGIAWIVIPEDHADESHAEAVLRRQSLPKPVAIGLGLLAAVVLLGILDSGPFGDRHWGGGGFGLLVLIGVGVWLFGRDRPPASIPLPPAPAAAPVQDATLVTPVPPAAPPPPAPARPREPASKLGVLVVSAMLLAAGVLALLEVDLDVALALLLVVLGAGLLVGSWVGRARWLILLGVPLAILAAVATIMDVPFAGGAGERTWRPVTAAQLDDDYRLGVGEAVLDLSELDLDGGRRQVEVSVAVGELQVLLPRTADVTLDARAGLGRIEAPGFDDDGADIRHVTVYERPGGGSLDLEIRLGIGELEVIR